MLAAAWGSPLIVDGKVYIGDEDGDVTVFRLTSETSRADRRNQHGQFGLQYADRRQQRAVHLQQDALFAIQAVESSPDNSTAQRPALRSQRVDEQTRPRCRQLCVPITPRFAD